MIFAESLENPLRMATCTDTSKFSPSWMARLLGRRMRKKDEGLVEKGTRCSVSVIT